MPVENYQMASGYQQQPNDIYLLLVRQTLEEDKDAFLKLYNLISPILYGSCLQYVANEHDANDVLQLATINIYLKLNTFNNTGSFIGWAKKLCINQCLSYLRNRSRNNYVEIPEELEDEQPTAMSESKLSREELVKILQKLPDKYRLLINLYFIEGYKQAEIAEMLCTTEPAIKATMHRAKNCLSKYILEAGGWD